MLLKQRIRHLIYVPQVSGGRKTFLHFYWDGKAWSLRDFSDPDLPPKPRYWPDPHLTVEQILALARAPGAFCIAAPAHPVTDVRFWHEATAAALRKYLAAEPDAPARPAVTAYGSPSAVPPPAHPATGGAAQGPQGTTPIAYRDQLRAGFWRYRREAFAGADDLFDDNYQPGGAQPPVFKPEHAHRNVLLKLDASPKERDAVLSAVPTGTHHQWFRSMTSSQALAQSVFANLGYHDKLALLADLRGDGLPLFPAAAVRRRNAWAATRLELEYHVRYLGEPRPTSVDVMFDGDYRVAVECKLSEPEAGSCSRPRLRPSDSNYASDHCDGAYARQQGRHDRCALTERGVAYWRYIPRLLTWPTGVDLRPCPLRATYQLVRNILAACVRPNGDVHPAGHAVLLYDARNPEFAAGGNGDLAWQAVRSALVNPVLLRRCTWQELVAYLRQDVELLWLTEALRSKYGL